MKKHRFCENPLSTEQNNLWEKIRLILFDHLSAELVYKGNNINDAEIYHLSTNTTLRYTGKNYFSLFGSDESCSKTITIIEDKSKIELEEIVKEPTESENQVVSMRFHLN